MNTEDQSDTHTVSKYPSIHQNKRVKYTIPFTGMRRTIAGHMMRSISSMAQVTFMGELDMNDMTELRSSLLVQKKSIGANITFTDLIITVLSRVIKEYPYINSSLVHDEIVIWEDINIAVAVALPDGLITPVIKNADKKSLFQTSNQLQTLIEKSRKRELLLEDLEGGTFTFTNFGAIGGGRLFANPIISESQAAILGTGAITDRPLVKDRQIVIRPVMAFMLTIDHRLIDGAQAIEFIELFTRSVENKECILDMIKTENSDQITHPE